MLLGGYGICHIDDALFMVLVHQYEVEVITGNHWAAETDADLFVTIFGDKGDSGRRKLYHSYQEGDKFQRGKVSL